MRIDPLTGEEYDADLYYRGERGLRKRSEKSFSRSAQLYHDYLKADSSFTFKEWLQNGFYKEYER